MVNETKCVGICKYNFLIFQKGYKRKNCVRVFKVCKYTFLIFEERDKLKRFVKICKYTFFNIWKKWSAKKLCEVFLGFISIPF